jgi:hypothetical protein
VVAAVEAVLVMKTRAEEEKLLPSGQEPAAI